MRFSVRHQVVLAVAAYATTPRKQWVRDWPAMVVLAVSAIYWSREVEEAISEGSVPAYLDKCSADLLDLTDLVRGRLSGQERLTLGALITIDVHARDVVAELAEAKIKNVSARKGAVGLYGQRQGVRWVRGNLLGTGAVVKAGEATMPS